MTSFFPDFSFLLGGYDLEMIEIKNILDKYIEDQNSEYSIQYFDKNLSWGAKLSAYSDIIRELQSSNIVGIELIEDIKPPDNYIDIDHHNEKSNQPSSIEQVADLLGITLTRRQQLIAENDKGYIPAMMNFGATEDEINEIRRADRKAQGVSEEDEKLAVESIENQHTILDSIHIIKSMTPKFSTITDRMFGKTEHLIIYTSDELNYYGPSKDQIANHFQYLIDNNKAYHGGGKNGFFGIASGVFNENELLKKIEEIVRIINK